MLILNTVITKLMLLRTYVHITLDFDLLKQHLSSARDIPYYRSKLGYYLTIYRHNHRLGRPKHILLNPLIIIFCIPLDCKISYSIVVPDENDSISAFLDWLRGTGNGRGDCSGADLHVIYFKNTFNAYKTARGQINM